MKKLFLAILLLTPLVRCPAQQSSGTLAGFLAKQGLGGAKLERRVGNHLFVPVSINNRRAALMIDTGSPNTVIDANSVNTFGLTVDKTDSNVGGLFGRTWERFGTSKVKSIAMGNCTVTNVPVAIADFPVSTETAAVPLPDRIFQIQNPPRISMVSSARTRCSSLG